MELISRRIKSLLKRVEEPDADRFDIFMHQVIMSLLTKPVSTEQLQIIIALLQKEGYLA
jgi:hypothetical protein